MSNINPAAPTGLKVTTSPGSVTLTWTQPAIPSATPGKGSFKDSTGAVWTITAAKYVADRKSVV